LKGNILEIGSGIGNISKYLIEDGLPVTLSDVTPEYCNFLTEQYLDYKNVKAILILDLQDPDFFQKYAYLRNAFDSIFLLNVIEHLEDDLKAMAYCHYLLKEGGNLILLAPAYPFLYARLDKELGHFRRYTLKSLKVLFQKQHFSILHGQYFNFWGVAGWLVFGKCLGKKMIGAGEISIFDWLMPVLKVTDRLVFNRLGLSVIVVGKK
jgi:SAM-dependent methyltransferase